MALILNKEDFTFSGKCFNITQEKNNLLEPYGKQIWNYGIVLTLKPNENQTELLNKQIGNARFVANQYLATRKEIYNKEKRTLSVNEYSKIYLQDLKEQYPFLKQSDKFALASAIEHIDIAFKNFFTNIKKGKKAGFPKFET